MNNNFKYLSFNSSRGNGPLAESTAIGSPMMQSNDSFRGSQKRKTLSPLANANKQRHSMVQIEPHILTNAQSRGIVKRLVTYYDESQSEGDRSRYVYNRVGDFPLVQLKKNEIKRNLVRSSSVRIAPPNKSMMNRDVRAAILRSNSFQVGANVPKLMPVKMRAKDDSHQIITNHDPLPIESPQAANSALEALEKNCRKRFNNEELAIDRNKRICASIAQQEAVDGPSSREFAPIPMSAKRNREQVSPNKKSPDSPTDQQRKKTRNNAYLSSLSSSQFLIKPYHSLPTPDVGRALTATVTAKRIVAPPERKETPLRETASAPVIAAPEKEQVKPPPVEKRLHLFNVRFDASTAKTRTINLNDDEDGEPKINFVKPREKSQVQDVDVRSVEKEKLSLMLSGLSGDLDSKEQQPNDSVDAPVSSAPAAISFTTTTTSSTIAPITTPALVTSSPPSISTTSSLLAPAAKNSEVVAPVSTSAPASAPSVTFITTSANEAPKALTNFQFGVASTSSTTTSTVPAFTTSAKTAPLALFSSPAESTLKSIAPVDPNKSLMSFTPVKPAEVTAPAPAVVSTSSIVPAVTAAPSLSSIANSGLFGNKEPPKISGGFSFGNSNETSATTLGLTSSFSATPTTTAPSISFPSSNMGSTFESKFGSTQKTTPAALGKALNESGVKSLLSNTSNLASTTSFMAKPETTTASGIGFSFSNTQGPVANTLAPATTAAAIGGFSFGSSQSTTAGNVLSTPVTTANSFNFGASTNPAFGQPTTSPQLGFGQSVTSTQSAFGQPAPTSQSAFGQPAPTTFGQPAVESSSFSGFGQKATPQPAATSSFPLFGQKSSAPATTTSAFSFGGSNAVPATTQSSAFSFGQSNQAAPSAAPGASIFSRLGDKQAEAKSAFSFGGSSQAAPANTPSLFGNTNSPAQSTGANLFGSTSSSAFNQTIQPSTSNNMFGNNTQPSTFGGDNKQTFAFGASNNVQPTQSAPQSNSMFSFGNSSSTPAQSPTSSNIFGASAGSSNVSASFTFKPSTGTVSNNATPVFGQNQMQPSGGAPPAYQFGQQPSNTVSTSYNFSGASTGQTAAPSGFNFSGPQSAPPTNGAFNFQNQQMPAPQLSSNMFNIGTGGSQQRGRNIRQATRRINK